MKSLLASVVKLGLSAELSPLQQARVLIINWFVLVGILIASLLLISNIIFSLYLMALICAIAIIAFSLTFYFNQKGKYHLASIYFIMISMIIVYIASMTAFSQGRFTETENILYGGMILSVFVFDRVRSGLFYFASFASLMSLKVIKTMEQQLPFDQHFLLTLIITGFICTMLLLFANLFKKILIKSIKELNEQKDLLYNLIDNIPLYIGIFNNQGRYSMVNKRYEEAFLMKREEIIGKRLRDIIPEENIPKFEPMLNKALDGESVEFHLETPMKSGAIIFAHGKYVPVFDQGGKVKYVTVALYDVTDMEHVKQQLEEANTAKNRLFNIVAHDIRNPLYNFELILESQQQNVDQHEEYAQYLDYIKGRFSPLKATIHGLLEWSIAQLNGITTSPKEVTFERILNETIDQLSSDYEEKSQSIEIKGQLSTLIIDEGHLKIILRNLVHNAIKFSPENEVIHIDISEKVDGKYMRITDRGPGMSEEIISRILSKKIVEPHRGTKGETGAGIGLSFCAELIEKNNGSLSIKSEEGEGSSIEIRFQ